MPKTDQSDFRYRGFRISADNASSLAWVACQGTRLNDALNYLIQQWIEQNGIRSVFSMPLDNGLRDVIANAYADDSGTAGSAARILAARQGVSTGQPSRPQARQVPHQTTSRQQASRKPQQSRQPREAGGSTQPRPQAKRSATLQHAVDMVDAASSMASEQTPPQTTQEERDARLLRMQGNA